MAPLGYLRRRSTTGPAPRRRPSRPARARAATFALALLALVACAPITLAPAAGASAASPIEAVWSFNGGEVAIQPQPGGTYTGTVVAPTRFAQCSHAVGERMWTDIKQQEDGSYLGFHQWFFEGSACIANPTLGPTAWRVLKSANGSRTLIVCFSAPNGTQPRITPSDVRLDVSYGCFESTLIGPLPEEANVLAFRRSVSLPTTRKCFSARVFPIHLKDPLHDPLKSVTITLNKRRVTVVRRGKSFVATVNLKGLPRGTFTVHIVARTVLGHVLSGSRTYHTCRRKSRHATSSRPPHERRRHKR